jgi:hypothetical protein
LLKDSVRATVRERFRVRFRIKVRVIVSVVWTYNRDMPRSWLGVGLELGLGRGFELVIGLRLGPGLQLAYG